MYTDSHVRVDHQEDELNSLSRALKAVLTYHSFQDSSRIIFYECKTLIGAKAGSVSLIKANDFEIETIFNDVGDLRCDVDPTTPNTVRGIRGIVFKTGKAAYDNAFVSNEYSKFLPPGHVQLNNVLFAPLNVEGRTVGLLGLAEKENGFSERDKELASTFGEVIAIALVNSRKQDTLEERNNNYRKLAEELDNKVKAQEEQLVQKQLWEEIGRISSELAHDMRGPLQTITNSVYLIERRPNELDVYLPKIKGALGYATALLDSFREYYRGHELTLMNGNVNKVMESCIEDIQIPSTVKVVKKLDPNVQDTMFDTTKLRRAFWNLVKNGVEAMQDGGTLTLESADMPTEIVTKVIDTGTGIAENIQPKIFIAFGSKKRGGMGLGLAVAKRIVDAHGGRIYFETVVGKGTTFTIIIPKKGSS